MVLPLRRLLPASVVVLAACTASSPQPQPPSATGAPATAEATSAPVDIGEPAGSAAASAADPGAAAIATAEPGSTITNEPPPGGRVTSNATPAATGSDRMQAMMDLLKANRDGFRKCFDLWGKKNPGQAGKIAFQFFLKPDGTLEKAGMKRDEGDIHAAEVESCMIDYAKKLTYPKSAVGKDTVYTHRFEFKAAPK